jgi:hypothetical protein
MAVPGVDEHGRLAAPWRTPQLLGERLITDAEPLGVENSFSGESGEEISQRPTEVVQLVRAAEASPAFLDGGGGFVGDRWNQLTSSCEEDELRSAVVRVCAADDVTRPLELLDGLRHRLLANV